MKLISIAFSHYVEKARWALDRFGVPYEDARYMPTFHFPAVLWATRGRGGRADRVSSRFSTPILLRDDGTALRDSSDIVRWVSDTYATRETTLYPTEEVGRLEAELGVTLGPHTRRVVYDQGLADAGLMRRMAERNVGATQAALWSVMFPVTRTVIIRALHVTPAQALRSLDKCRVVFDEIEARRQGRPFLVGDRLSAADIAFATMAAPVLMPSPEFGYAASLPTTDEMSPRAAEIVTEFRDHPAGRFALGLFQNHRKLRV